MKQLLKRAALLVACLCLQAPAHASDIYKWVNENNEIQYTQTPPPHGIKAIRIQSSRPLADAGEPVDEPPADATAAGESEAVEPPAADEAPAEAEAAEAEEQPDRQSVLASASRENCEKARNNLAALNRGNVRLRTPDGQVMRLTDEEREQKIAETNAQIELFCTE